MKNILLLACLLFLSLSAFPQKRLEKLVDERQNLHRQWKASESKKSGIFGNRTKKDMIATNEWMERIILKDNLIMDELEMLKNIETTEIKYEKDDYKFIAQKQEQDISKLKRALKEKDKEITSESNSKRTYEWTTLIFFLSTVILGFLLYRIKSRS
ncbi:Clp protease ClpB [Echinicola salinicaeni]|uniref:Clp protease ClpB n=1 Tax=Echinicola salinicaeni TaxID=2762757 RepID=UPI0016492606|nr:Clp protease ClpB [Echinicola salinicaeni]